MGTVSLECFFPPTRGNCDMIRKRKSTDLTHFFPSQGAAEVSMKHLAPVPLCPSHNERMKVNLTFTGYSCPSGGCSVTYTEGVGYFRFVNGFQQRPLMSGDAPGATYISILLSVTKLGRKTFGCVRIKNVGLGTCDPRRLCVELFR